MKRIVYTLAVGKKKFAECALGLGRSLRLIGDTTHRVVVTDIKGIDWHPAFDEVIVAEDPIEWIFFSKLTALKRTDADQVLFIDGDSLAFKRLDDIFNYCEGKGFAVQGQRVSAGSWYGDVQQHCAKHDVESLPQFNGGMIYYERTQACMEFIETIYEYGKRAKELGFQRDDPLIPDEPCIALAMAQHQTGHLIPDHMDFSNTATGLIGKLELDILKNRCSFVCRRYDTRFVEPYLFHAARYINFLCYWKQLDKLEALDLYEKTYGFGHMSSYHKLRRSVEKRILRIRNKI